MRPAGRERPDFLGTGRAPHLQPAAPARAACRTRIDWAVSRPAGQVAIQSARHLSFLMKNAMSEARMLRKQRFVARGTCSRCGLNDESTASIGAWREMSTARRDLPRCYKNWPDNRRFVPSISIGWQTSTPQHIVKLSSRRASVVQHWTLPRHRLEGE